MTIVTPGAGGYGVPAERDPALVARDVRDGKVSGRQIEPSASNAETVALCARHRGRARRRPRESTNQAKKSVTLKLTSGNASSDTAWPGPCSVTTA